MVPTVAPDELTVVEGIATTVDILTNDDYLPGVNTSIVDAGTGTAAGTISFDPTTGEMTYTSAPGEEGTIVTVDYTVCNTAEMSNVCSTATITIDVLVDTDGDEDPDITDPDDDNDGNPDTTDPNPLVPKAVADMMDVEEGVPGIYNIIANDDYDPALSTLTITNLGTGSAAGTISFDPTTGEMTYTSAPDKKEQQ